MKNTMKFLGLVALFLALNVGTNLMMNGSSAAGPPECVPGDIDGDGNVQLNDAVALLQGILLLRLYRRKLLYSLFLYLFIIWFFFIFIFIFFFKKRK